MNTLQIHPVALELPPPDNSGLEKNVELWAVLNALRRQKVCILSVTAALAVVAGTATVLIPGRYESEVTVFVQPVGNLADPNYSHGQAQPEIVRSQLEVIQSQSVIQRMVDDLGLMKDPEFAPRGALRNAGAETRKAAVISNVAKRLKVDNDGRSVAIHISFEARSAEKAARIADAIANEYIETQGALKSRAVKATKDRLDNRLAYLRDQALASEQVADRYRRNARLIPLSATPDGSENLGDTSYTSRLLAEVSRQTADLTASAAQADARARDASADMARNGGKSTPEALSSPVISALLQRDTELAGTESSMVSRYSPDHPLLLQVRAERAELQSTLKAERNNIERSLKLQAKSADAAEHAANAKAAALEERVSQQIASGVRYRQLEREANIKRKTYEDFALQSGTISERSLLELPDAVLVSPASLPIKESWPNRPLLFVIACLGALVLGCTAGLLRELRFSKQRR